MIDSLGYTHHDYTEQQCSRTSVLFSFLTSTLRHRPCYTPEWIACVLAASRISCQLPTVLAGSSPRRGPPRSAYADVLLCGHARHVGECGAGIVTIRLNGSLGLHHDRFPIQDKPLEQRPSVGHRASSDAGGIVPSLCFAMLDHMGQAACIE